MSSSIIYTVPWMPNRIIKNITWLAYYTKIELKVNYIWVKDCFYQNKLENVLISFKIYGRRHSILFTDCHASWETLYFPKRQIPKGIFPTGNFSNLQFPKRQLPKGFEFLTQTMIFQFLKLCNPFSKTFDILKLRFTP